MAHYLKALGILRLVAEQKDPHACGRWRGEYFELRTSLSCEELQRFFLEEYRPTPIVVPWSGNDFFAVGQENPAKQFSKPPTSASVIEAVLSTTSTRLEVYRDVLRRTLRTMADAGVKSKKSIEGSGNSQRRLKADLLTALRNALPDDVIGWLDAASVIEPDVPSFNALLGGGGGSDGNSHFSDNYMQCLWMALPDFQAQRQKPVKAADGNTFVPEKALDASLFGTHAPGTNIARLSPVLFDVRRWGGPNQTNGFQASAASNPWDFILMMDGTLLFAGTLGRKFDSTCAPSARFPFLFQSSPVGLGSSIQNEAFGRELWMPLWEKPSTLKEVSTLFAEGRVEKHGHMVKSGSDVFAAMAQLGCDRGISSFQRIGFFKGRIGGNNYYSAVDQGRIYPERNPHVDLLRDVDQRLDGLTSASKSDKCPSSVARAMTLIERRITALSMASGDASDDRLLDVMVALGGMEKCLGASLEWAKKAGIRPLTGLSPSWFDATRSKHTTEFRLAASLAGLRMYLGKNETLHFRQHLEQVAVMGSKGRSWFTWLDPLKNDAVWHDGGLVDALNGILARRLMRAQQAGVKGWPDWSPRYAMLDDITAFIEGRIDERLFADLLWGLALIDWEQVAQQQRDAWEGRPGHGANELEEGDTTVLADERDEKAFRAVPSSFYSLLRLCFQRTAKGEDPIPLVPGILHRAMAGDGDGAARLAVRRLRASSLAPLISELPVAGDVARRTASSMLFPIAPRDMRLLGKYITEQEIQTANT
ncbi:MAG: type I-U CRISPR-associated protein Csx17 [Bacteroidetes bacterium]|nr:type I-U CRISPR-associated protein Csx17 [Bacteroidota bacterium]